MRRVALLVVTTLILLLGIGAFAGSAQADDVSSDAGYDYGYYIQDYTEDVQLGDEIEIEYDVYGYTAEESHWPSGEVYLRDPDGGYTEGWEIDEFSHSLYGYDELEGETVSATLPDSFEGNELEEGEWTITIYDDDASAELDHVHSAYHLDAPIDDIYLKDGDGNEYHDGDRVLVDGSEEIEAWGYVADDEDILLETDEVDRETVQLHENLDWATSSDYWTAAESGLGVGVYEFSAHGEEVEVAIETSGIDLSIVDHPSSVHKPDPVEVTVGASAIGDQDQTIDVEFTDQTESESLLLDDGDYETFDVTFTTADVDTGTEPIEASSEKDTATVETQIIDDVFEITDFSAPESVAQGDDIDLVADLENTGGADGEQEIVGDVGGEVETTTVELDSGDSTTVTLSVDSSALDTGSYTAELSTDDDAASDDIDVVSDAPTVQLVDPVTGDELGDKLVDYGDLLDVGLAVDGEIKSADEWNIDTGGSVETIEEDGDSWEIQALGDGSVSGTYDGYTSSISITTTDYDPDITDIELHADDELVVDVLRSDPASDAGIEVTIIDHADGEVLAEEFVQPDPGEWGEMSFEPDEDVTVSIDLDGDYEEVDWVIEHDDPDGGIAVPTANPTNMFGVVLILSGIGYLIYRSDPL